MQVWILTFNRPEALNRLVKHFGEQGLKVNIFSNHPKVMLERYSADNYINQVIVNTLNSEESNSWCARSWNTIMMKAFESDEEAILIQDDTDIDVGFVNWINEAKQKYDFIWGPAGDQFFFIRKSVLQKVGFWDERYIGCYCGDADFVKRVYMEYDRSRISVVDSHNWGFNHNDCGLGGYVITTYQSKTVDANYDNQHWEFERRNKCNPTLAHSQNHFRAKWGVELDNNQPVINSLVRKFKEIDWYPWFSQKHEFTAYVNNQSPS